MPAAAHVARATAYLTVSSSLQQSPAVAAASGLACNCQRVAQPGLADHVLADHVVPVERLACVTLRPSCQATMQAAFTTAAWLLPPKISSVTPADMPCYVTNSPTR